MSLSTHISAEKVLKASREHSQKHGRSSIHDLMGRDNPGSYDLGPAADRYDTEPIPKYSIPSKGVPPRVAYDLVTSELALDGKPFTNLASFVHTSMDEYGDRLTYENRAINLIDGDEYPATQMIHARLVSMVAKLWHAADQGENATGCATTGSSEAAQLGGLAMKKIWQERRKAQGKSIHEPGPNIVMGANAQVALEKFARYFDVEARMVPVDASTNYVMDPKRAMQYVDENTIGVFVILGSTYTGTYEDVKGMSDLLDEYEAKTGNFVPIHVDAASGGFFAPFATPSLTWDFKLPRVVSINASGHKYGKAYVGVGIIVWRDKKHLPKDLVFTLTYLGSVEHSFSLNFSRPAAPIIGLYYNLISLGFEGYRRIALHDAKNARLFSKALENSKYYKVVSRGHLPKETSITEKVKETVGTADAIDSYIPTLPVVAFKFSDEFAREYPRIKQVEIQKKLRQREWIVPNYDLPPNAEKEEVLRVVFREKFSEDLTERLFSDIIEITEQLMAEHKADVPHPGQGAGQEDLHNGIIAGSKGQTIHEKIASSHGEGTKPVGHDSYC
ncbi:hypothetical protein JCM10908_003403 [Rhodotorula pacifica]|uniref:uncharacterized protein n=1 Tax=Rhodotorula pacifica TaxID=1495444 RepID=UPI003179DA52